jgi:predicted RNA-binding protein associated with RNAse of E/G family
MDEEATVALPRVHIHYRRPPDRTDVFVQELLLDSPEVKVTFQPDTPIETPVRVGDAVILEPGSPVVWFTFPGEWHDIGRFHRADGTFTGIYANVLTPCVLHREGDPPPLRWETTDLFLDVWQGVRTGPKLLDEPELATAVREGHVPGETAERARLEARRILAEAAAGRWPPPVVREWTLERAGRAR